MTDRRCFLTHFILCLGIAAGAFLAWVAGLPTMIWAADASHMTSAIALLFVAMMIRIGWQAWSVGADTDREDGESAQLTFLLLALIGTGVGFTLKLQAGVTAASLAASGTAVYSMICGAAAAVCIEPLNLNLRKGINRASNS